MGFSSDYLYYFHYSNSMGYLIFCCHSVATKQWIITDIPQWEEREAQVL